ncbi:response regulator [Herbaspirillum robiniae]|uniref:Two-component system response regulator n=1 Tax=Herbaspirillum robiniae TaxID=2014887 RepID=A0A246WMM6_9BURK|nr:response regulator [Herbaspirillum robiniae]OWY27508.1 two-component system response regulator [Herbaspirillum robiniae]
MDIQSQAVKTILVADDSSAVRRAAAEALDAAGYQVLPAVDGVEMLALLAEHAPDMVVCDVSLPHLPGRDACRLIRRNERYVNLPIVMLSSANGLFDRARSAMAGADDYLVKPFSAEGLLQIVRAYVDGVDAG